jgi:hypothetical protein
VYPIAAPLLIAAPLETTVPAVAVPQQEGVEMTFLQVQGSNEQGSQQVGGQAGGQAGGQGSQQTGGQGLQVGTQ